MITIHFIYYRKKTRTYEEDDKTFDDVSKALRFMYGLAYSGNLVVSYQCDDSEDKEFLDHNFSFPKMYYTARSKRR